MKKIEWQRLDSILEGVEIPKEKRLELEEFITNLENSYREFGKMDAVKALENVICV